MAHGGQIVIRTKCFVTSKASNRLTFTLHIATGMKRIQTMPGSVYHETQLLKGAASCLQAGGPCQGHEEPTGCQHTAGWLRRNS